MMRFSRERIRALRYAVQAWFVLFCIYIGYRFYMFVHHFETGGMSEFVQRPPSVEGFLPIAGFMSFKYFVLTGTIEPVHPAALFLFMAVVAVSVLFKKAFCGWICPIGTISQYLWMAGEKLFGRNYTMPRVLDIALRGIKYLAMGFFLVMIGLVIRTNMMLLFFISDYYKIVDVRTMRFFTEMSTPTAVFLVIILLLSLFFKNPWCRYLCPYGALLGLVSKASPVKVTRDEDRCLHCGSCTRHCPCLIDVEHKERVASAECIGCLTCVSHCPSKGALDIKFWTPKGRRLLDPLVFVFAMVVVFYVFVFVAKLTGHWQTALSYEDYLKLLGPR